MSHCFTKRNSPSQVAASGLDVWTQPEVKSIRPRTILAKPPICHCPLPVSFQHHFCPNSRQIFCIIFYSVVVLDVVNDYLNYFHIGNTRTQPFKADGCPPRDRVDALKERGVLQVKLTGLTLTLITSAPQCPRDSILLI